MTDEQNVKQGNEFDGMRQLNFSVRLGNALISVDFDDEAFLLRYRPNTPGGKCYEWRCNADGSIEEKNAEVVSTSTQMTPEEARESAEYLDNLVAWRAAHPAFAEMIDRAHQSLRELEALMVQGYVVREPR